MKTKNAIVEKIQEGFYALKEKLVEYSKPLRNMAAQLKIDSKGLRNQVFNEINDVKRMVSNFLYNNLKYQHILFNNKKFNLNS